ncbi:hypothetical protein EDD29_4666 [Actinocorallia herbida]|uniref:Neocarzinostatin family protein n=1 Tax=Actinocorallia herbida TaxID=58109 RepID=A0A3N1D0M3_9ACTN|nr:hypothetical protein [Actinocorallia herbida]ROO87077.1 hypothetical protein EDD29_4666 [Actinocorallia herbida]
MSRITELAAVAAAAAAAVALTATSASAAPWTGGSVSATLTQPLTVSLANAVCTTSTLSGSTNASNANLVVSTAAISGCTADGVSGLTVTPEGTPWGGNLTPNAASSFTGFQVRAKVTGLVNCLYGGTLAGTAGSFSGGSIAVTFSGASISKISGSGILSGLCPATINVSGQYTFTGPGL